MSILDRVKYYQKSSHGESFALSAKIMNFFLLLQTVGKSSKKFPRSNFLPFFLNIKFAAFFKFVIAAIKELLII